MFKFMRAKCKSNSTESTNQALAKSATKGTAMVVTVSVTFLLLNTPEGLKNAVPSLLLEEIPWYRVFMNITSYLNHSINGVLYCIVGTRFRRELSEIFCSKERSEGISSIQSLSNSSLTTIGGSRTWLGLNLDSGCEQLTQLILLTQLN